MNFFRRWHAHHEFRHHFGDGHHGHHFGSHADGFAYLLVARLGRKLALGREQQQRLGEWLEQLQRQRDSLGGLARAAGMGSLLSDEAFDRQAARRLLDERLDALHEGVPGVVNAFAAFFDSLDAEQRRALRLMASRPRGCGANNVHHAPTAAD